MPEKMRIEIEFSDDSVFGPHDEMENVDVEQSIRNYHETLQEALAVQYPQAEISVTRSINNRVMVDDREDDDEVLHQVDEALDHTESRPTWLASLESSLTGQRQGFGNLEDLFAFLRQRAGIASDPESEEARVKGP